MTRLFHADREKLYLERRAEEVRRVIMRSCGKLWFPEEFLREMKPGQAIHANRQTGKTEAIMYMVRHCHGGQAEIVACNDEMAKLLRCRYRAESNANEQLPIITSSWRAARESHFSGWPMYCDEWWAFPNDCRRDLLKYAKSRIYGAIGTLPCRENPFEDIIEIRPLDMGWW